MDNTGKWISGYITKVILHQSIKFLLSTCVFKLENKEFQQVIWISIGLFPAPYFANLSLNYYKSKKIKEIKETAS